MAHRPDIDNDADHAAIALAAAPAISAADSVASQNARNNLAALATSQPAVAAFAQAHPPELTWNFGRDGALTALMPDGRWWGGCSVPAAASEQLLQSFKSQGTLQCYLNPTHAAELRVALQRAGSQRAIAAIIPEPDTLALILRAEDFSVAIAAGRLYLAAGPQWIAHLQSLFDENPGLPVPVQFVRTALVSEESSRPLIDVAQELFGRVTAQRAAILQDIQNRAAESAARKAISIAAPTPSRCCVVAPSRFGLWNLTGLTLHRALIDTHAAADFPVEIVRIDPDHPASASPLALAIAAENCDLVITADSARSDLPNLVPRVAAWISWLSGPRIPAPPTDAESRRRDGLLLADAAWLDAAFAAGWPRDRIGIATWPSLIAGDVPPPEAGRPTLGMIADVNDLAAPAELDKFSSQKLLWETIADELTRDPLAADDDPGIYLHRVRERLGVGEENLDCRLFIESLILPAYAIGIARRLRAAGLPLAVFGSGWDNLSEFTPVSRGPVANLDQLAAAARSSAALVHAWPGTWAHPIDALGCPVIRRRGRAIEPIFAAAKRLLNHPKDSPRWQESARNSSRPGALDWAALLHLARRRD